MDEAEQVLVEVTLLVGLKVTMTEDFPMVDYGG